MPRTVRITVHQKITLKSKNVQFQCGHAFSTYFLTRSSSQRIFHPNTLPSGRRTTLISVECLLQTDVEKNLPVALKRRAVYVRKT